MDTQQFCEKISRMLGGKMILVEKEPDCFQIVPNHIFIDSESFTLRLSEDGRKNIEAIVWRTFKKYVAYNNTGALFWFEDTQR